MAFGRTIIVPLEDLFTCSQKPSDLAHVRKYAGADGGFAAVGRISAATRRNQSE